VLVQVQDATVTSVVSRYGDPVLEDVAALVPSIEGIFAEIQEAITLNVNSIVATYHEVYGYPTSVYIDYDARIADEELSITVDYLGPVAKWQSGLDTATSSWEEAGLVSYTYVYQRSCYCLPEDTTPKVVEVVDGVVISVDDVSGNDDNIPTIEGLFEEIQRAIDSNPFRAIESNAFRVDVQYDAELGYPLSIYIDYEEFIADEELIISATLTPPTDFSNLEQGSDVPSHAPTSSPATGSPSTASPTDESSGSTGVNVACWGWLSLFALKFCRGHLL
jgi:hypothetical protein